MSLTNFKRCLIVVSVVQLQTQMKLTNFILTSCLFFGSGCNNTPIITETEPELQAVVTQPIIVARLTDRKEKGLNVYQVYLQSPQGVQEIKMISGRPWRQDTNQENIADIGSPLPKGTYIINPVIQNAPVSKFGGFFVSIEPNFNTPRYDLGLHHDQEFSIGGLELGTMGCLATMTETDRKILINFIATQKPTTMLVY